MFSLIIFSVVLMGTMSENYNALYSRSLNAGWEVRADVNGSEVIADFEGELAASGLDTSDVHAIGMTTSPKGGFADSHAGRRRVEAMAGVRRRRCLPRLCDSGIQRACGRL